MRQLKSGATHNCIKCGISQILSDETRYRHGTFIDGTVRYSNRCKSCHTELVSDWVQTNRERYNIGNKLRYRSRPFESKCSYVAKFANRRAKFYGVSGRLTSGDILELVSTTPLCYICGKEIDSTLLDWSLDHVIPYAQGGTNEFVNLAIVHAICNSIKQDRYDKRFPWYREPDEFNASSMLLED